MYDFFSLHAELISKNMVECNSLHAALHVYYLQIAFCYMRRIGKPVLMHCYTQRKRERIGEILIADMVVFKNEHSFLIEQVNKKTSQKKNTSIQLFNQRYRSGLRLADKM